MSFLAMAWATKQKLERSTDKFILLMLSSYANEDDEAYPSVNRLIDDTSMDRKTVLKSLAALQELGFISDTGKKTGRTSSVTVYKIETSKAEAVPKIPRKQSQKSQHEYIIEPIISPEPTVQDEDPISAFLEAASPPPPSKRSLDDKAYWDEAVGMLMALGLIENSARSFAGRCLKLAGGKKQEALEAIERAVEANPLDPVPFITSILGGRKPTRERKQKEIQSAFAELLAQSEQRKAEWENESNHSRGGGDADSVLLQPQSNSEPDDVHQDGDEDAGGLSDGSVGEIGGPKRGYLSDL